MFEGIELSELIELLASGSSVKRVVGTDVDPDKDEKFKEDAVVVDVKVVGTVEVVEIKTGVRADSLSWKHLRKTVKHSLETSIIVNFLLYSFPP